MVELLYKKIMYQSICPRSNQFLQADQFITASWFLESSDLWSCVSSHCKNVFRLLWLTQPLPILDVFYSSEVILELSDIWIILYLLLQIKLGHIYYMHDSTESREDSFTVSAEAYELHRRSLSVTISVTVIPVNDEPPKLTRNTGMEVMFCSLNTHLLLLLASSNTLY